MARSREVGDRCILASLVVLIAIGLWWQLPKWQVHGLHNLNAKEVISRDGR